RVRCECHEDAVICSGKDTGSGIAEEHLPFLVGRFYRVDRGRSCESGGVGLGLSIAQRIVKAHGGTIDVCSEVGSGTTIVVTLPGSMLPSSMEITANTVAVSTDVQFSEMTA
ncbi:MAG: sensor histidine kinase, partial [Planctomyces sp.]